MKYYSTFALLILFIVCGFAQTKNTASDFNGLGLYKFYENDNIKVRLNEIVRTDSIYDNNIGHHIYKWFDKLDTLVQELKFNHFQSDTRRAYLTRHLYNKNGKIILYELFNMEGKLLEGFKYEYTVKGLLTKKEKIDKADN